MEPGKIIQRFDALVSQRKQNDQTLQWIERYVCPFRGKFFRPQTSELEIEWTQRLIYDSTAIDAASTLAASLHGSLTSPAVQWFDLRFRKKEMNENTEASAWLEECAEITYQALQDSNFGLEINEHYLDLTAYGTAILSEEIKDRGPNGEFKGVNFKATPLREGYFEEDHEGKPLRFYRRLQWQAVQICDKFGRDNVPEHIRVKADSTAGLDQKIDLIYCVFDRPDKKDIPTDQELAPDQRPFGFKYILKEGQEQLGDEGGYYEMPVFFTRWRKVSGSRWGHSPAHIALPSILQLNQVMEIFTVAAEKALDPPMATEQRNIIGDLNLNAADLTVMRDIDKFRPLTPETRMDMVQFEIGDLRRMIRAAFHVDELELKESPAMTATEVMARTELMQRLLGPTLGRLVSDLFDPLIQRTFNILWREKMLPEAPEAVMNAGAQMDVEYSGPMSRAQKTDQVASLEGYIMGIVALAEFQPDILDNIDFDKYAREVGEMRQSPAGVMRSKDEVKAMRDERQKKQDQQEQVAMAQEAGKAGQEMAAGEEAMQAAQQGVPANAA